MKNFWMISLLTISLFADGDLDLIFQAEKRLKERKDARLVYMEFPEDNNYRRLLAEKFSLINVVNPIYPELKIKAINTTLDDRKRCVISYVSWNEKAEAFITDLINSLIQVEYKGHVLYRIGGWPNMENGCLEHCHVPYGFKACAFLEAFNLGYQQALWLDSRVIAIKNLDPLFEWIVSDNCLYRLSYYPIEKFVNPLIEQAFNLKKSEWEKIDHVATGIVGLNLINSNVVSLIRNWHQTVLQEDGYFSFFPDQIPFSYLLNKHRLLDGVFSPNLVKIREEDVSQCFFYIDYSK